MSRRAEVYPVPRSCMLLLLAAQLASLGPHLPRLPLVLVAVALLSVVWRLLIHTGRADYPGRLIRNGLALLSLVAIGVHYRSPGLDPAVALLVAGASLKLLEMRSRRDVILVVTLGYFVTSTQCLFSQSLVTGIWLLLPFWLASAALTALYGETLRVWSALRTSAGLMLQAVPLMVVLFLVFPRLGPLWAVPLPEGHARTGLSEEMSPGDLDRLMQSDALAFRARFEGEQPAQSELYWRAMTYERFDGRRWSKVEDLPAQPREQFKEIEGTPRWRYELLLEPSGHHWLVVLDWVSTIAPAAIWQGDGALRATRELVDRHRYLATASEARFQSALPQPVRYRNLVLPPGNPQARKHAEALRASSTSVEDFVQRLLALFREQGFVYSLSPQRLGSAPVDEFLFGTRTGFCEHFASATAFMLRAGGVPARVVAGYQGGQYNPDGGYWQVHQYDAHAWVEYWQEGRGWQRLDPTAAIAPDRIDWGSLRLLEQQGALAGTRALRHAALARWVGLRWDELNYAWQRRVVGYDSSSQQAVIGALQGLHVDTRSMLRLALAIVALASAVLAVFWWRARRSVDEATRLYLRACRKFERAGLPRLPGEGPWDYQARVARGGELRASFGEITELYSQLRYGPPVGSEARIELLRRLRAGVRGLRVGAGRLR